MIELPDQDVFTIEEVAGFLRVHPRTIQNMLRRKELGGVRVGRKWRVPRIHLQTYLSLGEMLPRDTAPGADD